MPHVSIIFWIALAAALGGQRAFHVRAQCVGPLVNQPTLDLIKEFEGWQPDIYTDPAGLATVGYGHLCDDAECSDVEFAIPLSEADGENLLRQDAAAAQDCITQQTAEPVTLNANQYGALVSWAYNVGCGAAGSSTLIKRLNEGVDPLVVAREELPQWNKGGGEVLPGLDRRRKAEIGLFEEPTEEPALPADC